MLRKWLAKRALSNPKHLGGVGEWLAYNALVQCGYDVLARNWQAPFGEVDIIARKDSRLHFVEVKSRLRSEEHPPEESVTAEKIDRYHRLATYFLKEHQFRDMGVCYHIVAIEFEPDGSHRLKLLENAF